MVYWVVGGVYRDTQFRQLAEGEQPRRLGPFECYERAFDKWRLVSQRHVGDACARFRIVPDYA